MYSLIAACSNCILLYYIVLYNNVNNKDTTNTHNIKMMNIITEIKYIK